MLRIQSVLIAMLVAVAVSAAGAAASGSPGPRIYLPEPTFDFGTVREGDQPEHVFEIKNVGNDTLIISQVRPS